MRYRMQDLNGDYTFGQNGQNFYVDSVEGVAQAISTTLKLWVGEWFLDLLIGVAWLTNVIGFGTEITYDQVIRDAVTALPWVTSIVSYRSSLDAQTRVLTVSLEVDTIYGVTTVIVPIPMEGGYGIGPYSLRPYGG